jgi:cellulose synthase/poly-beta-1,6-N-acetylglucosamine synthase-like glycosyltransferase
MISIVITSFNEPKTIGKAIESFLKQNIHEEYELIVAAADEPTQKIVERYKNKNVKLFKDPGKGKSYALNLLLPKLKGDILIFTDGDVYVSENSVNDILRLFRDPNIGCVTGRPISQDSKENIFGYWSHVLCGSAHILRKFRSDKNKFLECSGYLWAFRNNVIKNFPLDVGEDTIVPIMFFLKGYKIRYSSESKVYVKFPSNLSDFLKQKRRAAAAHDNIGNYVDIKKIPRMKTFFNEVSNFLIPFYFPTTIKEFFWTFLLYPLRLYIWLNLIYNSKFRKRKYSDAWKRVESTK